MEGVAWGGRKGNIESLRWRGCGERGVMSITHHLSSHRPAPSFQLQLLPGTPFCGVRVAVRSACGRCGVCIHTCFYTCLSSQRLTRLYYSVGHTVLYHSASDFSWGSHLNENSGYPGRWLVVGKRTEIRAHRHSKPVSAFFTPGPYSISSSAKSVIFGETA